MTFELTYKADNPGVLTLDCLDPVTGPTSVATFKLHNIQRLLNHASHGESMAFMEPTTPSTSAPLAERDTPMTGIDFATQLASVAHEIALLNTDTEDNPEYYRGQIELAAAMLPGDSEQLRELLDLFVPLIRATENVPF